jgi:hypothetical protein
VKWVFRYVVTPGFEAAAKNEPIRWQSSDRKCEAKEGESSVEYATHSQMSRNFRMQGKVSVADRGEKLTVSVDYLAYGKDYGAAVEPDTVRAEEPRSMSWPINEVDERCIGQWVSERLDIFLRKCKETEAKADAKRQAR